MKFTRFVAQVLLSSKVASTLRVHVHDLHAGVVRGGLCLLLGVVCVCCWRWFVFVVGRGLCLLLGVVFVCS